MHDRRCPVCGNIIKFRSKTIWTAAYQTKHYSFCSGECRDSFEKVPERYTRSEEYYRSAVVESDATD